MTKKEMMNLIQANNEEERMNDTYYLVERVDGVSTDTIFKMTNDWKEALKAYNDVKFYLKDGEQAKLNKAVSIENGSVYYEPIYTFTK